MFCVLLIFGELGGRIEYKKDMDVSNPHLTALPQAPKYQISYAHANA